MPVYAEKQKVNGQTRWFIRTYVTDQYGNQKQVTRHNKGWIGREGKKQAEYEENTLKNKIFNEYEDMTLDELYELYFKDISSKLKASTIRKNKDNYEIYIKPFLGKKKIFSLSNKDILNFHNFLNDIKREIKDKNSKREKGHYSLSITYKQSIHVTLVSILNFGCKYTGLSKNVASVVGNFKKAKGTSKKELNFLTSEEFKRFIKTESNQTYKDFFTILFFTGMRRGELLALSIEDIDFDNNEIIIHKSINPKNGMECTVPKTDKSNRRIKMLKIVRDLFQKYKDEPHKYIFGLDNIKPTTLQRKCDKNCKNGEIIKNIRIHDFRHSFASLCINKGVPIEIISEYLGHENISTTLETYAHLYPNSQDKLISILDETEMQPENTKFNFGDYIIDLVHKYLIEGKSKEEIKVLLECLN